MDTKLKKLMLVYYVVPIVLSLYNLVIFFFIGGKELTDYLATDGNALSVIGVVLSIVSFLMVIYSIVVLVKVSKEKLKAIYKIFPIYYSVWWILSIIVIPLIILSASGTVTVGVENIDKFAKFDIISWIINLGYCGYMVLFPLRKK